jgi:hypothetical protein
LTTEQVRTETGGPALSRRPRRRSGSTEGFRIDDEDDEFADSFEVKIPVDGSRRRESLCDGYVVDPRGKIRGEARSYDPYSRWGEIMLYDIDIFGFVAGYVSKNWHVMSERDLLEDRKLARRLKETKYQAWKRHNVMDLHEEYERKNGLYRDNFERFCREMFDKI